MRSLTVLIKPVSGLCNMRCRYCFYTDVATHRDIRSYGIMKEQTAETLIDKAFAYANDAVTFAFQGGEPTLATADFYRFFTETVIRRNSKKVAVSYSIQTNGYNLSEEMCEILQKHHFLVGVSLDGTSALHDAARVDAFGEGTFKKVNETISRLEKYGIEYNILTVITNNNAKNIAQIYNYFRSKKYRFVQFIKHIDGFGDAEDPSVYSLSPKRYASFLKTSFGYYYNDILAGKYISIREFDNFVRLAAGLPTECCGMNGVCTPALVIEADGSAFPCDFYVLDEWKLGNIIENTVDELFATNTAKKFIERSRKIDEKCLHCKYFRLCRGGCARYREPCDINGLGRNKYCESYWDFFDEAAPKIMQLASIFFTKR